MASCFWTSWVNLKKIAAQLSGQLLSFADASQAYFVAALAAESTF